MDFEEIHGQTVSIEGLGSCQIYLEDKLLAALGEDPTATSLLYCTKTPALVKVTIRAVAMALEKR